MYIYLNVTTVKQKVLKRPRLSLVFLPGYSQLEKVLHCTPITLSDSCWAVQILSFISQLLCLVKTWCLHYPQCSLTTQFEIQVLIGPQMLSNVTPRPQIFFVFKRVVFRY